MAILNEEDVIRVIEQAFEGKEVRLDKNSSSQNIPEWDSLNQINIIVALNEIFDGKVGAIQEMASADSVAKIIEILKANQLM